MAQALPYVGAAVGGMFGMPQVGWFVGSLAASIIDPQKIQGQRLTDLRVQSSTYGRPIPMIFGGERIAGNMIWGLPLKEVKSEERAGKGGPQVTNYTYYGNCAIGIVKGPIAGLRRIWADGKVLYDNSDTSATVTPGGSSPLGYSWPAGSSPTTSDPSYNVKAGVQGRTYTSNSPVWALVGDGDPGEPATLNRNWDSRFPSGSVWHTEADLKEAIEYNFVGSGGNTFNVALSYANGKCYADCIDPTRAETGYYDGHFRAVFDYVAGTPTCPAGYQYDATQNACVPMYPVGSAGDTYGAVASSGAAIATPQPAAQTSRTLTSNLTLYYGTEDQLPDPNIEAAVGVGNVPAHRGMAYVAVHDLPLANYGNRIPNFEFEVIAQGAYRNVETAVAGAVGPSSQAGYAYDPVRGQLWSFYTGTGAAPDYFKLDVTSSTKTAGTLSGADSAAFKTGQLARYDAAGDCLWVQGTVSGNVCFAKVNPSTGLIVQIVQPSPAIAPNLGGFCLDSKRQALWVLWRSADGNLHLDTVAVATGVVTPALNVSTSSTNGISAINGNVQSVEYHPYSDQVFVAYENVATSNNAITYTMSAYNSNTLTKVADYPATGPGWFIVESSTQSLWFYDGANLKRIDRASGNVVQVATLMLAGATADGSGHVGAMVSTTGKALASFDSTGTFNGKMVTSSGGLLNQGYDVFADLTRGLLVSSSGYVYADRFTTGVTTVADIFLALASEVKVSPALMDVSDVGGDDCIVQGFGVLDRMKARDALQFLVSAYGLCVVDNGQKVKVMRASNAPYAGVISLVDQAARESSSGGDYVAPLQSTMASDFDVPQSVEIFFDNPELDYRQDVAIARKVTDDTTVDVNSITLPMVLPPDRAQVVADMLLGKGWLERTTHETTVGLKYAFLDAGDVVDIENVEGTLMRIMITQLAFSPAGLIKITGVAFDYGMFSSLPTTATTAPVVSTSVSLVGSVRLMLLDTPILSSQDDSSGFYALAYSATPNYDLRGSDVYISSDGSNYNHLLTLERGGTVGTISAPVSAPLNFSVADSTNSIKVVLSSGSLYSATAADLANGANLALIGEEVIQFGTAAQNADGSYTLSQLSRGLKGTESLAAHIAGEAFVLLSDALQRVSLPIELNGQQRWYKVLAPGQSLDSAQAQVFANTDVGLMPYTPANLQATRDQRGLNLTWVRRSRVSSMSVNGFLPLGEAYEAYQVDILDTNGAVKRTLSTTSPSLLYTTDMQQADFGATPQSVHVRVYQMSATVGRGFALDATV